MESLIVESIWEILILVPLNDVKVFRTQMHMNLNLVATLLLKMGNGKRESTRGCIVIVKSSWPCDNGPNSRPL